MDKAITIVYCYIQRLHLSLNVCINILQYVTSWRLYISSSVYINISIWSDMKVNISLEKMLFIYKLLVAIPYYIIVIIITRIHLAHIKYVCIIAHFKTFYCVEHPVTLLNGKHLGQLITMHLHWHVCEYDMIECSNSILLHL